MSQKVWGSVNSDEFETIPFRKQTVEPFQLVGEKHIIYILASRYGTRCGIAIGEADKAGISNIEKIVRVAEKLDKSIPTTIIIEFVVAHYADEWNI